MTTLLLVEADVLVRGALAGYLRECGFQVLEAVNYGEARRFLEDQTFAIEIVLTETGEGEDNGFALASWIRKERPEIEVMLAGSTEAAAKKAGDLCEEQPSVAKPYDHQLVLERIRRALAARSRDR